MKTSNRYWPLIDEIRSHFHDWENSEDFNGLPDYIKAAMNKVINELKVIDAANKVCQSNDFEQNSIRDDKIKFLILFKIRYLELTDLTYSEPFNPTQQRLVTHLIETLSQQGANYVDYLTWFFDVFCANKDLKSVPTIPFVCSDKIRDDYLYSMKKKLKMTKGDVQSMATRNLLLQIAIPFLERCQNKDLSAKMMEFSEGKISATKFFELLKAFANKMGDQEAIEKCNEIESRRKNNA